MIKDVISSIHTLKRLDIKMSKSWLYITLSCVCTLFQMFQTMFKLRGKCNFIQRNGAFRSHHSSLHQLPTSQATYVFCFD